jgi:fructose-1,6-bisphosphatase/inositol monophosphatase family enzyme
MSEIRVPSLPFLVGMTREAARSAAEIFQQPRLLDTEWKADNTPVTAGDRAAHDIIVERMSLHFPHIPIVGEEGNCGSRTGSSHEYWLSVDEIDGTAAFSMGIPVFVTMVALMRGTAAVKSVIHDPVMQRTYSAEDGRGACLDNLPIATLKGTPKKSYVSLAVWPGQGGNGMLLPRMISGVARELHDRGYCVTTAWSIGYSDALVACGKFVGSIFAGDTVHDTAAPDLLVREAGGVVTDLWGKSISYDGSTVNGHIAACDFGMHLDLLDIVRRHDNRSRS